MFALALLLRVILGLAFDPAVYDIPSRAMMPTLNPGDVFLVDAGVYAPSGADALPHRGDVAVFRLPGGGPVYVKRVVGLPGERVRMVDGAPAIDGVRAALERLPDDPALPAGMIRYSETLPGGTPHVILDAGPGSELDDTEEVLVPADRYFVLGDNRDVSRDSRDPSFGMVPVSGFLGRVEIVVLTRSEAGVLAWTLRPVR